MSIETEATIRKIPPSMNGHKRQLKKKCNLSKLIKVTRKRMFDFMRTI